MNYVKLIAPAKVNLVLAVGDVREDGFHQVDTIMHALALHDVLELYRYEPSEEGAGLVIGITTELDEGIGLDVPPEENIVYRAIMQLAQTLGRSEDEEIQVVLKKHIPREAGLGGGSSDAAAALRGAALLWGLDTNDERLFAVAQQLGSDVAFFLQGGCVYLQGKGDVAHSVLEPRKGFCVLARPASGVSTKAAYEAFDKNPVVVSEAYRQELAQAKKASDVVLWNNMAEASRSLNEEVAALLSFIDALPAAAGNVLCGSGSAVCIPASSYDNAMEIALALEKQGYWTRVSSFARVRAQVIESA